MAPNNGCLHIIDTNKGISEAQIAPDNGQEIGYGPNMVQVKPTDDKCCCKQVTIENQTTYFIKTNVDGSMINPWSPMTHISLNQRHERRTGRQQWDFQRVPQAVFATYLRFLQTHNPNHLRSCERILKDG